MKYAVVFIIAGCVIMFSATSSAPGQTPSAPALRSILVDGTLEVLLWQDTCNVYVLREGDEAMLIDIGDGSVLEELKRAGIKQLSWVLLTHHHREQCQGHPALRAWGPQVAAPEKERPFFERPGDFRKVKPSLGDAYAVHGASYVRPPVEPLKLDRAFKTMDTFTWRGREFWCLATAGNSPGSMSYFLRTGDGFLAFTGDVIVAGARMHNWFDSEWDYGFGAGLYALIESASLVAGFRPRLVLPSHGPVITAPADDLRAYQQKLRRLARLYVRGYDIGTFANADQDLVSRPSAIPHLWQVTPHLFKFKGPNHWPNFTLLLADSGRALIVDCGLDARTIDATLEAMQQRLGLKAVDAVLVTHMHGDHVSGLPHLREKWGAKAYTLDRVAEICQEPHRFDYSAMPWAYSAQGGPVRFDRTFKSGEKLSWEGYELTFDWMPGQTEFACCIHGIIDGRRVAFTGDNIFGNPEDEKQTGHEALVARNSAILEEGYIHGAEYLKRLKPDLMIGGHSFVMDRPQQFIERFHRWSLEIRDAFRDLSAEDDYRYMFDPYWVRVDPYRTTVQPGGSADAVLLVRNFLQRERRYRVSVHAPAGITVEPPVHDIVVPAEQTSRIKVRISAAGGITPAAHMAALDVAVDGRRYGEWFDFIVCVEGPPKKAE